MDAKAEERRSKSLIGQSKSCRSCFRPIDKSVGYCRRCESPNQVSTHAEEVVNDREMKERFCETCAKKLTKNKDQKFCQQHKRKCPACKSIVLLDDRIAVCTMCSIHEGYQRNKNLVGNQLQRCTKCEYACPLCNKRSTFAERSYLHQNERMCDECCHWVERRLIKNCLNCDKLYVK